MRATLRIAERLYREAKAEAARQGVSITRFIEEALEQRLAGGRHGRATAGAALQKEIEERDRLMEALLCRTARFRVGKHPTREEMNAR